MNGDKNTVKQPRIIGYARVSTDDQNDFQTEALKRFGVDRVYSDLGISGKIAPFERTGFTAARKLLTANDTLVVWKLDRLGRSLKNVIETVDALKRDKIHFVSLTENIDTTSATGRAFWQFIGLMAELERGLISERTIEGMAAAKRRGVHIGRPHKMTDAMIIEAHEAITSKRQTLFHAAQALGVSPVTLKRGFERFDVPLAL